MASTTTNTHGPELTASERELLVRAAILAPSMHNTQPWLFGFRHRTVEVYRDITRELTAEDPDGRLTLIGVGAAVLNLRVAAATLALRTATLLLPDACRPTLAARLTLGTGGGEGTELAGLFPSITRRRTNRHPFADRAIAPAVRHELAQTAAAEGARLYWANERQVRWLQHLATDADHAEEHDPHRIVERGSWVGGERHHDGVPLASLGPRSADVPSPVRDLAVDPADRARGTARFEDHPQLAVLATTEDSPRSWLVAGQALQRVLLVATQHGLAASLLNQLIEHEELRELLYDPGAGTTAPQAVLRLGCGRAVPSTPRRPVEAFVLHDDETP